MWAEAKLLAAVYERPVGSFASAAGPAGVIA